MEFSPIKEYFQEPEIPEITNKLLENVKKGKEKVNENEKEKKKKVDLNNLTQYEVIKYLYQNTRGINTPKSYMVVLDSRVIDGAQAENFVYNKVVFDLCDPIIIDSPTDVYLEFLHFQNMDVSQANGTEITPHLELTSQFYIDIDEFSIKNISNNQFQSARFFIPNEVYGKTDNSQNDDDTNVKTFYIKLKSNYLCRIEANYIKHLTVSIRAESSNGNDGLSDTTYGYLSNENNQNNITYIDSQADLVTWATDGNDIGVLTSDITLSGGTWPLALNDNKVVDGNGYTITLHSGINSGLFSIKTQDYSVTVKNVLINAAAVTNITHSNGVLFAKPTVNGLSITATNCGCLGSLVKLGSNGGFIIGSINNCNGLDLIITNCFSEVKIWGQWSGGIIGSWACNGSGSLKIHNCFTTGVISGNKAGGITGVRTGYTSTAHSNAIITNCYSYGEITNNNAGGIVGGHVGGGNDGYVLIGNCYSFGDITGTGGGIAGVGAYGGNLKIENCYSVHATGTGVGDNKFVKSVDQAIPDEAAQISNCSAGSGGEWDPSIGTVLKDNYTDSASVLTDTDVWITSGGSFANGYGLTVFSKSPWNSSSYTANNLIPTFDKISGHYQTTGAVKIGLYFDKVKKYNK